MPNVATNRTALRAAERLVSGQTYEMMLLTGITTGWNVPGTARDLNTGSQLAADEASDASYARVNLASVAASEDDANDRAELDCADVTFPSLTEADILGVAIIDTANDEILSIHADATSPGVTPLGTPNGEDFIIRIGADGFLHVETA